MKLLVSYDGSNCSEAAIDDLAGAGLPAEGRAVVLTVAEVWLPPVRRTNETGIKLDPETERIIQKHLERDQKAIAEAATLARWRRTKRPAR